jgi:hypothetical protein
MAAFLAGIGRNGQSYRKNDRTSVRISHLCSCSPCFAHSQNRTDDLVISSREDLLVTRSTTEPCGLVAFVVGKLMMMWGEWWVLPVLCAFQVQFVDGFLLSRVRMLHGAKQTQHLITQSSKLSWALWM